MNKNLYSSIFVLCLLVLSTVGYAGNPDRQGEAGAGELLFNPWARSAGLHTLNTSSIMGVESMRLNVAGLGRIKDSELVIGNTTLYSGSDIRLNALGYAKRVGSNGAFGVSLVAVDFGDIEVTTVNQPEGNTAVYSPSFIHMGFGYAYTYDNKISVGVLFRGISESLTDVSAFGFAIDAGVQYVTGEKDQFKLGISLRNVGSPMSFNGEGLSFQGPAPGRDDVQLTFNQRSESFELPSILNIGVSYDIYFMEDIYLRGIGNFTSNAFSLDQIGVGAELFFLGKFAVRGGYRADVGSLTVESTGSQSIYSGLAFGASIDVPFKRGSEQTLGIDYGYRATDPYDGTHNVSIRLAF